jgi:hypothetical protein
MSDLEKQAEEIDMLAAMYPSLERVSIEPVVVSLPLQSGGYQAHLTFHLPSEYPSKEPPIVTVEGSMLSKDVKEAIQEQIVGRLACHYRL